MAVTNAGWYNENELRRFPFADSASTDIDNALIVDLTVVIPVTVNPTSVYVSEIAGFGTGIVVSINTDDGNETHLGTVTVPSSHERYDSYEISPSNSSVSARGRMVIGRIDSLAAASAQRLSMSPADGEIAAHAIRPQLPGLTSTTIEDSGGLLYDLSGPVSLSGGANVSINVASGSGVITVSVNGGVVIDDRFSGNTDGSGRTPLKSINGATPDSNGNINIQGSGCSVITSTSSGIVLEDTCAKPCCGDSELERVKDGFDNLGVSQSDINAFLTTLEGKVDSLQLAFAQTSISGSV